jgi:putative ABC transport system permease protein
MVKYALTSLKNKWVSSLLFIVAVVSILTVSTVSIHSLQDVQAQVNDDIKKYARGSYDILVRPKGTQTKVENRLGLVEENYLGIGSGGITLDTWKEILAMDDIEIAAPVASLGYFTGFSYTVEFPFPESSSLFSARFSTSDGIHEYSLTDTMESYFLEQEGYYDGFDSINAYQTVLGKVSGETPKFLIPQTYHLMVGIDSEQEKKLTGIDFSEVKRDLEINEKEEMSFARDAPIIKVLYLKDPNIPIKLHLTKTALLWDTMDTLAIKKRFHLSPEDMLARIKGEKDSRDLLETLTEIERLSQTTYEFDLSPYLSTFDSQPIALDYTGNPIDVTSYAKSIGETTKFYFTETIDYGIHDGYLSVKQVGTESEVPIHRKLIEKGKPAYEMSDYPFVLFPVGSYTAKENQKSLSASPLGIYHQAPTTTENGQVVHETGVAGSFIASPAHGVIQIEDAELIKGNAPIDAIRIKVSGISSYDDSAERKILDVVEQLYQLGDFQIDIVAGASPETMNMDVESIGMVKQQWTSIGAATTISDGWTLSNIVISFLFILIGLIYIWNRIFFWRETRQKEAQLLSDLGWGKRHITSFHLIELLILTCVSLVVSLCIIGGMISSHVLDNGSLILFTVCSLSLLIIVLIRGIIPTNNKKIKKQGASGKSIFLRNIYYYRKFIWLTFLQLSVVTLLVMFTIPSIIATMDKTGKTNLGEFINNSIHFLLLLVIIVSISLTIISVLESNSAFLSLRRTELRLLRDIGWKRKDVQSLCMKESAIWTFLGILFGASLGLGILVLLYEFTPIMLLIFIVIVAIIYGIVLILTYIVTFAQTTKI